MRAYRVPLALALFVVVVVGPVVSLDTAQPASRITLTAALVEHRSVDLGPYRHALGIDHATYRGMLRSDKAPGQPMFAIPAYALARLVGAPSASHLRVTSNLELWLVTLWSAMLPLACLVALLYLACTRIAPRSTAIVVALSVGLGTMLLPYAANLFGHDLAAVLGFGAWLMLDRDRIEPRHAAAAGLLAGAAVLVEYETAIIGAVLFGLLVFRNRRRIREFVAGGVLPVLVLAWYQWRAFGAPWRTPSAFYSGVINGTSRGGYSIPTVHDLFAVFAGGRGLWIGAPIAILAIGCAIWQAVAPTNPRVRSAAIVALAVVVPYIVLTAGWSGTPLLEDPGPRYLIPALPFLAVPIAAVWSRVRVVAIPIAVWGALLAFATTWTQLLVPHGTTVPVADRFRFQHHMFVSTLWSMAIGRIGVVFYALTVIGAALVLVHSARERTDVRLAHSEPLR